MRHFKSLVLSLAFSLVLLDVAVGAESGKITFDISFTRKGETTKVKVKSRSEETAKVESSPYRFEIKPTLSQSEATPKSFRAEIRVFFKNGKKKEELLVAPRMVMTDKLPTTFITEVKSQDDRIELKVIPTMEN